MRTLRWALAAIVLAGCSTRDHGAELKLVDQILADTSAIARCDAPTCATPEFVKARAGHAFQTASELERQLDPASGGR